MSQHPRVSVDCPRILTPNPENGAAPWPRRPPLAPSRSPLMPLPASTTWTDEQHMQVALVLLLPKLVGSLPQPNGLHAGQRVTLIRERVHLAQSGCCKQLVTLAVQHQRPMQEQFSSWADMGDLLTPTQAAHVYDAARRGQALRGGKLLLATCAQMRAMLEPHPDQELEARPPSVAADAKIKLLFGPGLRSLRKGKAQDSGGWLAESLQYPMQGPRCRASFRTSVLTWEVDNGHLLHIYHCARVVPLAKTHGSHRCRPILLSSIFKKAMAASLAGHLKEELHAP